MAEPGRAANGLPRLAGKPATKDLLDVAVHPREAREAPTRPPAAIDFTPVCPRTPWQTVLRSPARPFALYVCQCLPEVVSPGNGAARSTLEREGGD
jgi:hypothetical protein